MHERMEGSSVNPVPLCVTYTQPWVQFPTQHTPVMVMHSCDSNSWDVVAGGHPEL